MTLPFQFLQKRYNQRSDEYGGSLENRVRFIREILEDIKDAVGGDCAVAFRFAVDELLGKAGLEVAEAEDIVGLLADLPDLWDVNVSDWKNDSLPSRFGGEGAQEEYINFVKKITEKPVVGVGRFTSPDTMVGQIRRGVLDLIGATRAVRTKFGSASVATCACRAIIWHTRCAARKIRPWGKSGGAAGIRIELKRPVRMMACWWSAPVRQGSRPAWRCASAATTLFYPKGEKNMAGGCCLNRRSVPLANGGACRITAFTC
jgi:hypothetical protein